MIGFIGALFAGVFGILDKVLPGKKKDYFLDFNDAEGTGQAKTESAPAPQKKATVKEAPKPEQPKPEAKAASAKKKPAAKSEKKPQPAAKAQPTTPAPAANSKVAAKAAESVELFASNYLLPKPTARRRRPGANMASFVQMSREMSGR